MTIEGTPKATLNDYAFLTVPFGYFTSAGTGQKVVNGHNGSGYQDTSRIAEYDAQKGLVKTITGSVYKLGTPRSAWVSARKV